MFPPPTKGRPIARLTGAAIIGTGLVISGAGAASAGAPDTKALCAQFIHDVDRVSQCVRENGGTVPGCEDVQEGFSLQQCLKLHWNVGFGSLPGAPDNPGTPRASAPKPASKAPAKASSKKPTKKPAAKKPIEKATGKKR